MKKIKADDVTTYNVWIIVEKETGDKYNDIFTRKFGRYVTPKEALKVANFLLAGGTK